LAALMEGTPKTVNLKKLEKDFLSIKGVKDIHDLHVWGISDAKLCLTCHVGKVKEAHSL